MISDPFLPYFEVLNRRMEAKHQKNQLIGIKINFFRVKVEDTNAKVEISEDPSATDNENKEVDIPTLVAELVIEAHKKKMASRAQSRESILRPGSRQSR